MGKVLVSFEDRLLRRIDKSARSRGLSRSAYLSELAESGLARSEGPGKDASVRTALDDLDRLAAASPPAGDSTRAVRGGRDSR